MKFKITMKDPDGVYDCIEDAAKDAVSGIEGIDEDERADLVDSRRDKIIDAISTWFSYNEYLTVEVDTEAGTCTIVPK